jgi:hypothetical protein
MTVDFPPWSNSISKLSPGISGPSDGSSGSIHVLSRNCSRLASLFVGIALGSFPTPAKIP